MLNALEMVGFKSFPDRTRFDFPPGITVVVGPNGSGKSNIVDAIKWVMGEQSARGLRGKEMADVIFKGTSGPSGRRPSNTAEATIYLDNSDRHLRYDSSEISVTRRVYRSGEGEYLINGEPCRLKDIRNMFRGTGIGTDAYSLIEQGKVDQMLQASPRDRRAIFEEAAGISRFKAKKLETERRLARVDQNLVRLSDIVEEVEGHYKRVKNQAAKASKYKEYTERLKALRTHVGMKDWRDFSQTLEEILEYKQQVEASLAELQGELETREARAHELDSHLAQLSKDINHQQSELGQRLQTIAERQSHISLAANRADDQLAASHQLRESLARLAEKQRDTERSRQAAEREHAEASRELAQARERLTDADRQLDESQEQLETLRDSIERDRQTVAASQETVTELRQRISGAESQRSVQQKAIQRVRESKQQLQGKLEEKQRLLDTALARQKELQGQAEEKDSNLRGARQNLEQLQSERAEQQQRLEQLQREQSGASQRAELIQELEKQQEGVDSGVKELMARREDAAPQNELVQREVIGMVADLIKVNVQHADLIDLALGEAAQYVVVDGPGLIDAIADGSVQLSGRVGLIQRQVDVAPPDDSWNERNGVVGRLDQLVHAQPEHHRIVQHLLGHTWLVKSLKFACQLKRESHDPRTRLVTLEGEIVESNGAVIGGARARSSGIVSRRSELRALHRQLHQLSQSIRDGQNHIDQLDEQIQEQAHAIDGLLDEHSEISNKLSESRTEASLLENEISQLQEQLGDLERQSDDISEELRTIEGQLAKDQAELTSQQTTQERLQSTVAEGEEEIEKLEQQRDHSQQQVTTLKVQFAKLEQQVGELDNRLRQLEEQQTEYRSGIESNRSELAKTLWQRRSSLRTVKSGEAELHALKDDKNKLEEQLARLNAEREAADENRRENAQQLAKLREQIGRRQDELHDYQMREKDLSMQRSQLAERLKEDYDIDIEQLASDPNQFDEDREQIDSEINDLRQKLNNIGPVNMDALAELEEVEGRYESLNAQYQDLIEAKQSLEQIIIRINADSRKLFVETLEQIRANFQNLFRQTFGGGRADLVLEEGVDVLEAGIEITATPPGKPEFNNSLLSGGERALTAVSLLMAIFQFRPSPFCILDEVDAPFDEANIGRFLETLRSFLSWTKFVIVTHSKKTMTAANTLYGVTMQESGVSKRVSVRFEDVNEQGEISNEAVKRDQRQRASSEDDGQLGVA